MWNVLLPNGMLLPNDLDMLFLLFKPHAEGTILCPTPVRPNVSLPKFDSWPQPSIPERRGSLKVSIC